MGATEQFDEALHLTQSKRYAAALAIAASAEDRIRELTEALADTEYMRRALENQVDCVRFSNEIGKVYWASDPEPTIDDCTALLDIADGRIWERRNGAWVRLDGQAGTHMTWAWPLETTGPLLGFEDMSELTYVLNQSVARDEQLREIRIIVKGCEGYADPDSKSRYSEPRLPDAVDRVIKNLKNERSTAALQKSKAESDYAQLNLEIAELNAKLGGGGLKGLMEVAEHLEKAPTKTKLTTHAMVKAAELEMIQETVLPEEGDPEYSREHLLKAAAMLIVAAGRYPEPADRKDKDDVPEPF